MGAILMSAGILTAIILSVVGLIKLPFTKFKSKHPNWYKATFTLLSILLTIGACCVNQIFILQSSIFSVEFVVLLLSTFAGVFGLYLSYEGLGAKALLNKLFNALKDLKTTAPENKFIKALNKIDIGLAESLLNARKENLASKVVEVEVADAPVAEANVEPAAEQTPVEVVKEESEGVNNG